MGRPVTRITLLLLLAFTGCNPIDQNPPQCSIRVSPEVGDSLTVFLFDGDNSLDDLTEPWQLKIRWDAESDGKWETDFSISKQFSWRFPTNGRYTVTGEILDGAGNRSASTFMVEVRDVFRDSSFLDARDGHTYGAVLLVSRWWMSENLRFGQNVDDLVVTRTNGIIEYYSDKNENYGAFYTWGEATREGEDSVSGICPPGWRLPRKKDIREVNDLVYFRKNLGKYLLDDGILGLDLRLSGRFVRSAGKWDGQGNRSSFWINDGTKPSRFKSWVLYRTSSEQDALTIVYEGDWGAAAYEGWPIDWGEFNYGQVALPVRCVKDL